MHSSLRLTRHPPPHPEAGHDMARTRYASGSLRVVAGARLAVCASLAAALVAAPGALASGPALTLVRTHPVEVRASGFHASEGVRLTVWAGAAVKRSYTQAGADGRFTATVRGITVSRCAALVITATGSGGSRAVFRRLPRCEVRPGG